LDDVELVVVVGNIGLIQGTGPNLRAFFIHVNLERMVRNDTLHNVLGIATYVWSKAAFVINSSTTFHDHFAFSRSFHSRGIYNQ
jgi:hypothetical protein